MVNAVGKSPSADVVTLAALRQSCFNLPPVFSDRIASKKIEKRCGQNSLYGDAYTAISNATDNGCTSRLLLEKKLR